jgi:hypothetical protein
MPFVRPWLVISTVLLPSACSGQTQTQAQKQTEAQPQRADTASSHTCSILDAGRVLPSEVRETSGLAESAMQPGMFWTHNDSDSKPQLFLLDSAGSIARRLIVRDASIIDWEDIAGGPCTEGRCLFIGDIGDNNRMRGAVTIYRIPEDSTIAASARATRIDVRYPDGPQDAEAMFVLPTRDLYIVTKGRRASIALYRLPASHSASAPVTLTKVRELLPQPADERDRVTGATASPNGEWVAIRTYRTLYFYRADDLVSSNAAAPQPTAIDLQPLRQAQGESVAITADGTIWLSSEAENPKQLPTWAGLACSSKHW